MEEKYWEADRTIDEKVNRFIISVGGSGDQSDNDADDLSTDEGKQDRNFQPIYSLAHFNTDRN